MHGIIAADMAKEGMTGGSKIITYLTQVLGKDQVTPEKMVQDLGKKWVFCETWIKKYPVCFPLHRHVDTLLELRKEHRLTYEEIESVEADIAPCAKLFSRPEPVNEGDLQFSFQNVLGAAILDGDVNLSHVDKEALFNPRLKEARSKVKLIPHEDWNCEVSQVAVKPPVRVTVKTRDGRTFSKERKYLIGSPEEPLTMKQVEGLYSKYTKDILSEQHTNDSKRAILHLEELEHLEELMHILVFGHRI